MTTNYSTTYPDLSQGRIKHIDFHIQADFLTCTLSVEATYQMQGPVHGSLHLDTYRIEMQDATVNGLRLEWDFDARDDVLGERLHLKGLNGESGFVLKFRTSPEARALQWMNETQTVGGKHPFLYSECQASNARSIFPCQDTPSVRFTYSAQVEVPEGLTAVMAAEQVKGLEGNGTFSFRMPQPIPSYLFAITSPHLRKKERTPSWIAGMHLFGLLRLRRI